MALGTAAQLLLTAAVVGGAVAVASGGKKKKRVITSQTPGPFADAACKTWRTQAEQIAWTDNVLVPVLETEVAATSESEWDALAKSESAEGIYEGTLSLTALILAKAGVRQCSPWTGSPEKRFLFKSVWCRVMRRLVETNRIPPVGGSTVDDTVKLVYDACARPEFDPQDPADVEGLEP